jgi:hypothetical protein
LIAGAKGEGIDEALSHADSSERMGENVTCLSGTAWKIRKRVGVKFEGEVDFSPEDEYIVI